MFSTGTLSQPVLGYQSDHCLQWMMTRLDRAIDASTVSPHSRGDA